MQTKSSRRLATTVAASLLCSAGFVACAGFDETQKTKRIIAKHGEIVAEWQVRDDAGKRTYTYVVLKNTTGRFETHEIAAVDGQRNVQREQAGGIDASGCFLYPHGFTTPWIKQLPAESMKDVSEGTSKTQTPCLEYKETPAWTFVPEADKKAAEPPPPPPPEPSAGPDAGSSDGGTNASPPPTNTPPKSKKSGGDVESAIP